MTIAYILREYDHETFEDRFVFASGKTSDYKNSCVIVAVRKFAQVPLFNQAPLISPKGIDIEPFRVKIEEYIEQRKAKDWSLPVEDMKYLWE